MRGFVSHRAWHKELEHSSVVLTLWSGCPLFWPSWLCLSTMGKRQTVNYFVHITHVPQLRQEHLVTVPEITVPQWRKRKVRQMVGQRRKSRAASHPLLGFFSFHDSKTQWKVEFHYLSQRCVPSTLMSFHQQIEKYTLILMIINNNAAWSNARPLKWQRMFVHFTECQFSLWKLAPHIQPTMIDHIFLSSLTTACYCFNASYALKYMNIRWTIVL